MPIPLKKYLIVIAGPTASGKTDYAIRLAKHFQTDIISADARQFYREMHIGTAKPDEQQLLEVKHHFIDSLSIHDSYDVGKYETGVLSLLEKLFAEKDIVILCGGSGLFIKAVTDGLDELPAANKEIRDELQQLYDREGIESLQKLLQEKDPDYYAVVDIQNPQRLLRALEVCLATGKLYSAFRKNEPTERNFISLKICLDVERKELYRRINMRVDDMFAKGLVEEAKQLFSFRHLNALQTVGYTELFDFLEKKITLEKAKELIKQHTRNYAKRQVTWFKKDKEFVWVNPERYEEMVREIEKKMVSGEW